LYCGGQEKRSINWRGLGPVEQLQQPIRGTLLTWCNARPAVTMRRTWQCRRVGGNRCRTRHGRWL